ncbi:MAG TPA: Ig-like domain-containing protein [Thermoanaerobaculia bacterium]|nr:Ig-like domain-containing protein [Thermoanaerobaculia bacterium]
MSLLRRSSSALLAFALLASCATMREAGRSPIEGDRGAVRIAVFADDDTHAAGRLLGEPIAGALEWRDGKRWLPVFHSLEPSWSVAGLEPGSYRVRFELTLDETGQPEDLERPVVRELDVRAGEAVDVELVLDHVSPAMVAAGAAAILVAAVLLHEWLDDLDLPNPPLPPPSWAIETAFWVTLDLTSDSAVWVPRAHAPQITSHFPRAGAIVAPEAVRVIFVLSEPIDPRRLIPDAVVVETEDGAEIPGRVHWDQKQWWLIWEPDSDLPAGTRFIVTLRAGAIADSAGLELAGPTGFEFATSR